MAVEIFRGPDHMAIRMLTAETIGRQGRVCNAVEDDAFHPGEVDRLLRRRWFVAAGAVPN
jgi:hypothetical protein